MSTEAELRAAIGELAEEARLIPDAAAIPLRRTPTRVTRLVPVLAAVAVLAVAAMVVFLSHRSSRNYGTLPATPSLSQPASSPALPGCGTAVPAQTCTRVLRYAHQQANRSSPRPSTDPKGWPPGVTVVSILEHAGTETRPNVGPSCKSGHLVTVDIIGSFDTSVAPPPIVSGEPTPDYTVDDLVITADARSGKPCLLSVRTREAGPNHPPDGATIIYRAR